MRLWEVEMSEQDTVVWVSQKSLYSMQDLVKAQASEITTLRKQLADMQSLSYCYPPTEPFAGDGRTWQQRAEDDVARIIVLEKENDGLKKVIADHEITIKICQFNEKNQTSRAIRAEQALEDTK
jgi:hypothetical protein